MRCIKKPEDDQEKVFLDCISNIRDNDYKNRLLSYKNDIVQASIDYEKMKIQNNIHKISCKSVESAEDMLKLYNQKFVKSKSPGRKYYDKLKNAAPDGKCPLCGHCPASTIDHYLPKSKYPLYSITLINLIPMCGECNRNKGDLDICKEEDAFIHPYFDKSIDEQNWLNCKIEYMNEGLVFVFDIVKPKEWDDLLYRRMKNQFNKLKLNSLYSKNAGSELNNNLYFLKKIAEIGNLEVKRYINDKIESFSKVYNNSWQISMFRAMLDSLEIFCDFLRKYGD